MWSRTALPSAPVRKATVGLSVFTVDPWAAVFVALGLEKSGPETPQVVNGWLH